GVIRVGGVATLPAPTRHQWHHEAEAGPVERPAPGERPANVVRLLELETEVERRPGWELTRRRVGAELGAVRTGMSHLELGPSARSFPFHCHSAEEELFVVLGGEGTLRLGDERHPLR